MTLPFVRRSAQPDEGVLMAACSALLPTRPPARASRSACCSSSTSSCTSCSPWASTGRSRKPANRGGPPSFPFYNWWIMLKVAGRPTAWFWFIFLAIIPFIGSIALLVIGIIVLNDVSKSFGHGVLSRSAWCSSDRSSGTSCGSDRAPTAGQPPSPAVDRRVPPGAMHPSRSGLSPGGYAPQPGQNYPPGGYAPQPGQAYPPAQQPPTAPPQ